MYIFFFLVIRRPPRATQRRSSAASDVYKRQDHEGVAALGVGEDVDGDFAEDDPAVLVHELDLAREGLTACLLYTSPSPRDS